MSRPLNDDEVLTELKKMVSFIRQEAVEKAHEIQVKADEEFAIEKARIVRQEAQAIDEAFERKKKNVERAQKIAKSHRSNKARLQLLEAREKQLLGVFEAAAKKLTTLSSDAATYKDLLANLLLQGLFKLNENKVLVTVRSTDVQTVQDLVADAKAKYKETTGRETEATVQEGLPGDCAGGVRLSALGERIVVNNTLEERLHLLEEKLLPELRFELFGPNPNRKFFT